MIWRNRRFTRALSILMVIVMSYGVAAVLVGTTGFNHEAAAQSGGTVPGQSQGNKNDSEFWRAIRNGAQGSGGRPARPAVRS